MDPKHCPTVTAAFAAWRAHFHACKIRQAHHCPACLAFADKVSEEDMLCATGAHQHTEQSVPTQKGV